MLEREKVKKKKKKMTYLNHCLFHFRTGNPHDLKFYIMIYTFIDERHDVIN